MNKRKTDIMPTLVMIALAILIFILGYAIGADNTRKAEYENHKQTMEYTVKPNDTLWSIAEEYKPSWMDVREYIYEVKTLNDMDNSTISVGEEILIYTNNA